MGSALNFAGCLIGAPISSHITALRSTRSPRSASRSSVAHVSRCACLQFRALAVSTAMCGVLGAVAVAAMQIGLQVQPVARVSSVADAIALARKSVLAVVADDRKAFVSKLGAADRARLEKMTELERQEECVDSTLSAPVPFCRAPPPPPRVVRPRPHAHPPPLPRLSPRQVLGAV